MQRDLRRRHGSHSSVVESVDGRRGAVSNAGKRLAQGYERPQGSEAELRSKIIRTFGAES